MRVSVAFTSFLFLLFGVYSTPEDGFTSDIDWNKLTGTWFIAVSTKFNYWAALYKCHIFAPYNITDKGMQMYFYNIPVDSGSDAFGAIEDVIFGPGDQYTVFAQENKQWVSPEESIVANQKLDVKDKVIVDEQSWFNSHPDYFSTNYDVIIHKLKYPQGRMEMSIFTRNQRVNAAEAAELMNLARTNGANEDLEVKGCGDIAPQQYLKQS